MIRNCQHYPQSLKGTAPCNLATAAAAAAAAWVICCVTTKLYVMPSVVLIEIYLILK